MTFCTKEKIFLQMESLSILPSDTVLINVNFAKFGYIEGYRRSDYVEIFKEYFRKDGGTFVALAFTPVGFSITNKNIPFFDGTQRPYTGAFATEMLKDKESFRSKHPTNSVVAIGKNAQEFVDGLNENCGAYDFARRAIEMNSKILLIGMNDYPGFLTHLVEQDLKLFRKYWHRFFLKVQLKDKIYFRLDPGGCSRTFGRLYPEYIKHEALRVGRINQAYSLSIDAKRAYEIDYQAIKKNPNLLICNDQDCSMCRIFRWKTIWRAPYFVFKKIFTKYLYHKKRY